ncbi:MAG: EF-hand domain-containing protein [Lysobacterales bacterium]
MKSPAKLTFEAILLAAVIIAVLATPLLAEAAHHGDGPPTLEEFDGNGDGFLSEDEFNTGRDKRHAMMAEKGHPMKGMANAPTFADFDTNGDGQLSADEFSSGHEIHMRAMHGEHHDGKHDGKKRHATFEEMDLNGDGCIDRAEMDAHHAAEQAGHH